MTKKVGEWEDVPTVSKTGEWEDVPSTEAPPSAVQNNTTSAPSTAIVESSNPWKPNAERVIDKVGGAVNTPLLNATKPDDVNKNAWDRMVNAYSLLPPAVQYGVPASAALALGGAALKYYNSRSGGGDLPPPPPPPPPPDDKSGGGFKGLKARFFGPSTEAPKIEPTMDNWFSTLSPDEQEMITKSQKAAADKAAVSAGQNVSPLESVVTPTFEETRIAKQAAAAQAAQQSMATPQTTPEPILTNEPAPKLSETVPELDPKIPALLQPASTAAAPAAAPALPPQGTTLQPVTPAANAAPEPVLGAPAEPIAGAATPTTAAEPITPAAEPITPAQPVATTTETPATKATNDQILETLNKVAPKPEVTPETTPAEEKLKWPGKETPGAERWTLGQIGASRENYTKKHAAAIELLKDRTNGILTATHDGGGGLVEQQKLSDLVQHYTGKPIPSKEGGGFARIPKEQVAELHAGILSELQDAVKGGKLQSLGKGAMAAAALLGLTSAVQAAQKGNLAPLGEAGFDIGIGALGGPAVMAGQMAMTGQTLASGMTPKGQKEYQNRQEILSRPGVQEQLKYLNVLNPNLSTADFNKRVDAYLATNPNAPKTKLQQFNEQTRQQQIDQTQKEHSLRR